jgi:hypothetical protein
LPTLTLFSCVHIELSQNASVLVLASRPSHHFIPFPFPFGRLPPSPLSNSRCSTFPRCKEYLGATLRSERTSCVGAPAKHTSKPANRAFHLQTSVVSIPYQAPAALVAFQPLASYLSSIFPFLLFHTLASTANAHYGHMAHVRLIHLASLLTFILTILPLFHSKHNAYGNTASLTRQ